MTKKAKRIAAVSVLSLSMVFAAGAAILEGRNIFEIARADDAGITLGGSNGAVSTTSLKTNTSVAKTALGNDVKVVYKNAAVSSGKVGTVKKNGYYGNYDPIYAMSKIEVSSNAAVGDAVIKYGKTSSCVDGSVDLASGLLDGINANYFKIVANKDVLVNSIAISFACDNSDVGFVALNGDTDVSAKYQFTANSNNGYDFSVISASTTHYLTKLVVPDYYNGSSGRRPVTRMMNTSYYGFFEKCEGIEEIYLPETLTEWGTYHFNKAQANLRSLTFPRDLTKIGGNPLPTGATNLTTVYYNSKALGTVSGGFSSTNQPNLKDLYVSYDVESLPNGLVTSFPTDMVLHYEGTEAEWAALTASAANWKKATTVICSDTTVNTVTLVYANSSLDGDTSGSKEVSVVSGKTMADPGNPVWTGEGAKVFNGWYTQAEGGEKVSFPLTPTANMTLYAQFIDMPVGYSISDPLSVTFGEYPIETRSDLGNAKYFKFTASEKKSVLFEASNMASSKTISGDLRVYDLDGNQLSSTASSYSASEGVKKVSNLINKTSSNKPTVKVDFEAGESYIVAFSTYNFMDSYFGTATLTISDAAESYGSPLVAKPYEVGTNAEMTNLPGNIPMWHKFVPTESGTYTVEFNNRTGSTSKNCSNSIGYIDDSGAWVELGKSNYSATNVFVELEAGKTYYVVNTGNGTAGDYGFKVFKGTPDGYSAESPITITVNGDAVQNKNQGFYYNYYKIVIAEDGWYKLQGSGNIYSQTNTSYTSTSSYQYVQLSNKTDMSDLISGARYLTDGTSTSIYYNLSAGTYYLKATVGSSATTLAVSSVSNPDGLTVDNAKAITLTSGSSIDTSDAGTDGKLYKFTVTSADFHVFTASSTATVKIGTISTSSLVHSFSSSYEMSNGDLHKKLTVGNTYYLFVKGATSVGFETVSSIEDGESKDTAYSYTVGNEEKAKSSGGRVNTTTTYFKFAVSESGDYIATRGSTYAYYFKLYEGDSQLSAKSTSGVKQVFALEEGKEYRIEAYTYGFSINKAQPGYARDAAIDKTIAADDTSAEFACTFGQDGTWYKVAATVSGWYEFKTESAATADIYVGTSTSKAASASSTSGYVKVNEGDLLYICVKGTKDATVSFTIAHPASVENGLSADTAYIYKNDSGKDYMTLDFVKGTNTDSSGYFWIKATVEENTDYVFYSVSENDWDFSTLYSSNGSTYMSTDVHKNDCSLSATDTINGQTVTISEKTGSSNSDDFYERFNTGSNTTIYLKTRLYSSSSVGELTLKKASDFVGEAADSGSTDSGSTECTFDFSKIADGRWTDSSYDVELHADASTKTLSFYSWDDDSSDYYLDSTFTYVSESSGVYTFKNGSIEITVKYNSDSEVVVTGSRFANTYTKR